jgi:hypothetical protein
VGRHEVEACVRRGWVYLRDSGRWDEAGLGRW